MGRIHVWFCDVEMDFRDVKLAHVGWIVDKIAVTFSKSNELRSGVTLVLSLEEAKELHNKLTKEITYLEKMIKQSR